MNIEPAGLAVTTSVHNLKPGDLFVVQHPLFTFLALALAPDAEGRDLALVLSALGDEYEKRLPAAEYMGTFHACQMGRVLGQLKAVPAEGTKPFLFARQVVDHPGSLAFDEQGVPWIRRVSGEWSNLKDGTTEAVIGREAFIYPNWRLMWCDGDREVELAAF